MTKQTALSELLSSLGFAKMAQDVLAEDDHNTLCRYARIILKQTPQTHAPKVRQGLRDLGLIAF